MRVIYFNLQGWRTEWKDRITAGFRKVRAEKCKAILALLLTLISAPPCLFALEALPAPQLSAADSVSGRQTLK